MVAHALRAGEHGVVIRQHGGLDATDSRHPRDQPVGRGVGDQIILRAPAALRGHRQRAILHEASRIHQVGDVLAGGAAILVVPLGNGFRPALVAGEQMPTTDLIEVSTSPVQVECGDVFGAGAVAGAGEHQHRVSGSDHLPRRHQSPDRAHRVRRGQHMLHFHGLEHRQLRACRELGSFGRNLDYGASQLRPQHFLTRIQFQPRESGLMTARLRGDHKGGKVVVDEVGGGQAGVNSAVRQYFPQESDVSADSFDTEFIQGRLRLAHRGGKRRSAYPRDHFGQQRVIAWARCQSGTPEGVDPHAGSAGRRKHREGACGGQD